MPYVEKQKKKKPPKPLDSRPMTNEEKKELSNLIPTLPADKLRRCIEIIQAKAPKAALQSNDNEFEIDIEKIDNITLRKLEKFIKKKPKKKPKKQLRLEKDEQLQQQQTTSTTITETEIPTIQPTTIIPSIPSNAKLPSLVDKKDSDTESESDSESGDEKKKGN